MSANNLTTTTIDYTKFLNPNISTLEEVSNWINTTLNNYLKENKPSTSEVEHIIDYLVSDKAPTRLKKMSYPQAFLNAEKWNKALIKKGSKIKETLDGTEIILDFEDGFKIVKLISKESYEREGYLMRHCVASYYGKDSLIYSLRDSNNDPHCTLEKDIQIKGKGNGDIHPKYIDYIIKFLEYSGMEVRDSEMEHLGYKKADFPEYCLNKLVKDKYIPKDEKEIYNETEVLIFDDLKKACFSKEIKRKVLLKGNADFRYSLITNLGNLTTIGGYVDFRYSLITNLGNLTTIGDYAYFSDSQIELKKQYEKLGK